MASTDPAQPDASSAALIPLGSHAKSGAIELTRPITVIGSRKDIVRLHLQSSTVSKAHAVVVLNSWGCYVADLGSRTGTLVNGEPITDVDLSDGDVLQIGRFQFQYRAPLRTKSKRPPLAPADLVSSASDTPTVLSRRVSVLGRRQGADVQFDSKSVSNIHALIVEQDGRRLVRDLSSRTGTWLDGKLIHQEVLPPGSPVKIGGTTLTLAPRPESTDEPLTLAEAAPAAAVGLDGPAETVAIDALDLLDLPSDEAAAADDHLAALRRDWKAPAKPEEPAAEAETPVVPEEAEAAAEETAGAAELDLADLTAPPAEAPAGVADVSPEAATPVAEEPLDVEVEAIDLDEPADLGVETKLAAEAVTEAEKIDALDLDVLDVLAGPAVEPEAAVDDAPDLKPEPAAVEPLPVDERPNLDALAEPPEFPKTADVGIENDGVAGLDTEALDLDELELADLEVGPVAASAGESAIAESVFVDESGRETDRVEPLDLDVLAEPAAEAETPVVDDTPDVKPEPVTVEPPPAAERPNLDVLAGPPAEADAVVETDELETELELDPEPAEAAVAEPAAESEEAETAETDVAEIEPVEPPAVVVAETAVVVPTDADDDEAEPLDLEPLDLGDLVVEAAVVPDPDAPAPAAEAAVEDTETADVDALILDADAPAIASDPAVAELPPIGLEEPAEAAAEAASEPKLDVALPVEAEAETPAEDEPAVVDLEPLDLDDLELDLDAPKPGTAVDADLDALTLDPDAPAAEVVETPEFAVRQPVSDTSDTLSATAEVDQIDLAADEADGEEVEVAGAVRDPMNDVVLESAVVEPITPADASAATLIDRVTAAPVSPAETLPVEAAEITDPAAKAADAADAGPVEADHIRLAEDVDDEANEATALAVDLGLILEDEPSDTIGEFGHDTIGGTVHAADVAPAPGPETPVDIDLSGLVGFEPAAAGTAPAKGPDFVDADHVAPTAATAAAVPQDETTKPDADDHIEPPQGGSLADLMPGGPPLLGGSFMSMPQPLASIPSIPARLPPQQGGAGGKRRPSRIGFGGEAPKAAPFAAERTISDATGEAAFEDDDTLPAVRPASAPVDAFGAPIVPARPAAPAAEETPAGIPAERFRPRGTIRPVVPGAPVGGAAGDAGSAAPVTFDPRPQTTAAVTPAAVYSAESELRQARKHKLRVRRVITCLVLMILFISGAFAGVYNFMPLKSSVEALITFNGLDGLGAEDRAAFQRKQNEALLTETVRSNAITSLPQAVAEPGFLASGKTIYDNVIEDPKVRWPAGQPVMRLQVRTVDRTNDLYRIRALGEALVKSTEADAKRRGELLADAADLKSRADAYRRQLTDLSDQIQALEQAATNRPAVRNTSDLNAEYLAAEPALTAIKSQRQELEATVDRFGKPVVKGAAAAAAVDAAAADDELAKLTTQLAELQQATTRPAANDADARKKLDESIAQLEQNLADAQKLRDNPQLTAYVESASRLFKQMRDFTESLMRRQETMRTQLGELKARMSDNLQAVTQERLAKDAELKKLRDSLAITERQYNAANGSGFSEEAQKLELQLRLLKVKVEERQDQFQNDSVYSPAIASLQKLIDGQEAQIKADRKDIDDRLTALQGDFMKNAPAVEKLPAEQKQLAEGIESKMKAMNDARRQYAQASEAAAAQQAKAEADSREKVAALRVQIAARRQDVLNAAAAKQAQDDEQIRVKELAAAQAKLADVRLQEQKAAHRVTDATTAIEKNDQQRRINAQADADLTAKRRERDDVDQKLRGVQTEARTREAQIARLVVPDRKVDTLYDDDKDRRLITAGGIAGGATLLLLIPILLDLLALSREAHGHHRPEPELVTADTADGFEPLLPDATGEHSERKALPEPASVG